MNAQRPRSKKRSAGKERRSPTPVFLIDQCLGRHALATALAARGARAETLARHFADDTPDHARPEDVNLEARVWVPRDAKGGYSPGVYLNDDMLAAWTLFIEARAIVKPVWRGC